jgi:hypothetical protein
MTPLTALFPFLFPCNIKPPDGQDTNPIRWQYPHGELHRTETSSTHPSLSSRTNLNCVSRRQPACPNRTRTDITRCPTQTPASAHPQPLKQVQPTVTFTPALETRGACFATCLYPERVVLTSPNVSVASFSGILTSRYCDSSARVFQRPILPPLRAFSRIDTECLSRRRPVHDGPPERDDPSGASTPGSRRDPIACVAGFPTRSPARFPYASIDVTRRRSHSILVSPRLYPCRWGNRTLSMAMTHCSRPRLRLAVTRRHNTRRTDASGVK